MAASASPSPSGRMLVNFNGNSPATTSFDTGYIDVSAYAYFRISHTCATQNHKYIVYWSTTGSIANETITGATKAPGSFGTDILTVQARFGRFVLDLGAPATDAQLQAFFFDSLGAGSLKNLGAGAKIYSLSASGVRSLVSSDASLTVTESANEIDVTVAPGLTTTLSSAGGTNTLVVDGTGPSLSVKGLTAGTGISLTPGANDITIANTAGGSNWTVSGAGTTGYVYPTTVTGILSNLPSNTFTAGSTSALLVASQNTTHKGDRCVSLACDFQRWQGSASAINSAAIACASTYIDRNGGALRYFIQGACDSVSSNSTAGDVTTSVVLACAGGGMRQGKESGIIACNNSTMTASGTANLVLASGSSYIQGASTNSVILAASSSTITAANQTVVIGAATNASGTKSFTANLGSAAFNTNTANKWNVKAPGGAVYYSDDAATVGVSLAAGANSWAAVSDINKKENLQEVCYLDCLEGIANLPVYTYNFIGHTPRCIGPTAQDWNHIFPSTKDPLSIDQQDAIGISLAGIQGLVVWMNDLESRINKLEGK